ncbi:ABC transporter ATP-binding protein [Vulcanisaeta thermophila]|uniref:ABC transporter ATP-binding protein n=1 Tax=Vulcanisaeta thermophila TaxID=867917 RepID=UPI001EE19584|nr:ATP-binding cassette domain-containing protein [Vulcanisaeta thermophila]
MVGELRVVNVSKVFRGVPVLVNVSLTARSRVVTCVRGPSGSGKTTLLRIMAGLLRPDTGFVYYDGVDLYGSDGGDITRSVSYVPQDDVLVSSLTIWDNLDLALRVQGLGRDERRRRIEAVAEELGITHILGRRPVEVSGGERRRVSVAIALARDHEVLIMDEPSNSLDIANVDRLISLIRRDASTGSLVVIATHDDYLARCCDVTYGIRSGRLFPASALI